MNLRHRLLLLACAAMGLIGAAYALRAAALVLA